MWNWSMLFRVKLHGLDLLRICCIQLVQQTATSRNTIVEYELYTVNEIGFERCNLIQRRSCLHCCPLLFNISAVYVR